MVKCAQPLICPGGHDGTGALARCVIPPVLPDTCKGNGSSVLPLNVPRQSSALFCLRPLIEPCRHDQTPTLTTGRPKGGFLCESFGPGVDQQRTSCLSFVPMWQKSPTQRVQSATCLASPHHMYLICRTDVVVRNHWQSVRRPRIKQPRHCVIVKSYCKPSAHG